MIDDRNKNGSKLTKLLKKGDTYVFDEIYNQYNTNVYLLSLKNLRNKEDAEGVVQEVFMYLWKDLYKLKEIRNLDSWIFTITFNVIRKRVRKLVNERDHLKKMTSFESHADLTTFSEIEYNDLLNNAEKIIDQLPTRQKTVFLLSTAAGLSNSDISEKLNISKKTVENHLSIARAYLKKAFNDNKLL